MATDKIIPEFLEIGRRLELIREVVGTGGKADFAKHCGVQPNAYTQWTKGKAKISLPFALQVVRATGATLDYIYLGKTEGLPMKFMRLTQQGSQGGDTSDGSMSRKKAG